MDSKTPPISPTNTSSGTGSGTSQQAQTMSLSIQFAALLNHGQNSQQNTAHLSLPVSAGLSAQLANWLQQKPAPKIEQLPPNLANWLAENLNKHQSAQGLPRLTVSQWLPIIGQLSLGHSLSKAQDNNGPKNNADTNAFDVLRVVFLLGSQSPASKTSKLSNKSDGIAQLLKLLVPIPLQDKASLIIRERLTSTSEVDQNRQATNEPVLTNRDTQNQDKDKVSRQNEEDASTRVTKGEFPPLHFTLNFDLDTLGLLSIEFDLTGLTLSSRCFCSNLKLQSQVEQTWPQLEDRLSKFGFTVQNNIQLEPNLVNNEHELPTNKSTARQPSGVIDIKV